MATASSKRANSEEEVRAVLRRHFQKLTKTMLSPVFHRILKAEIVQRAGLLTALEREARRKKRTKRFLDYCHHQTMQAAGAIGPLENLNPEQVVTLQASLDLIILGMLGKPVPDMDPEAFLSFQRKLFVRQKKRGPKFTEPFNEAYERSRKGEPKTSIARTLQPEAFAADPLNALQKVSKAIRRRERAASKE